MKSTPPTLSRRAVFGGASAVGALAAAVTLLPVAPEVQTPRTPTPPPEKGGGYHLSEHVQRYFKTTRI